MFFPLVGSASDYKLKVDENGSFGVHRPPQLKRVFTFAFVWSALVVALWITVHQMMMPPSEEPKAPATTDADRTADFLPPPGAGASSGTTSSASVLEVGPSNMPQLREGEETAPDSSLLEQGEERQGASATAFSALPSSDSPRTGAREPTSEYGNTPMRLRGTGKAKGP